MYCQKKLLTSFRKKKDIQKGYTRVKSNNYSRQQEFELLNKNFYRTGSREATKKSLK